ncbi:MAG: DEAD/DEAH box helicase [Bacilli bacterium]|nr:DEAD/DEAH box helicase [Bacilli bacterium]
MKNNQTYCRLCISFQGREVNSYKVDDEDTSASLTYPLSPEQGKISTRLLENFKDNKSTLVHAVCGSGKTELVYGVVSYALSHGMHIGFAVPRREVAIDLFPRFISAFPNRKSVCVYGGHTDQLTGDIIILTTHQLYRYTNYFDLLILDEIDAFPFRDNRLLINLFKKSLKGSYILMSATPPKDIVDDFKKNNLPILELHTRYHRHALPEPISVIRIGYFKIFYLIKKIKEYRKNKKPLLIFAPTISLAESIYSILKIFVKKGHFVHSKCLDRKEIITDFKKHKYDYLVTTSVLERGVTIKDVQVIIYNADDEMYDSGVLIQISGRVGRKIDAPTGEVIFLANKVSQSMKEAIHAIKLDNTYLTR